MEELGLPIWVLAAAFLLNAFKGYLPSIVAMKNDKLGIAACNNKCDELAKQLEELKTECILVNEKYHEVNSKYYMLLGSMSVIKTKLKEIGFDDVTNIIGNNE